MRALCGAIITAGALVGLGLAAVGIGTRYQGFGQVITNTSEPSKTTYTFFRFQDMDTGLMFIVVALTIVLLIGLGIAFLGLAYHHERRHHEHLRADTAHKTTSGGLHVPA